MVSVLVFLGAGIVFITQTAPFRAWLRDEVVRTVARETNGALHVGAIYGNLVTGVRLEDVTLAIDGAPFASCAEIRARYNPLRLPSRYISLAELSVREPAVTLTRGVRDSSWNVARLLKPPATPPAPFAWTVEALDVTVLEGRLTVADSAVAATTADTLHVLHSTYTDVSLSASALISRTAQDVTIHHLSFHEATAPFVVRDLAATCYHTSDTLRMAIERLETGRSRLAGALNAGAIDSALARGGRALAAVPVTLRLDARTLAPADVGLFVPAVPRTLPAVALTLEANGTVANLAVRECTARLGASELHATGVVRNLQRPEACTVEVQLARSVVATGTLSTDLAALALPDLHALGTVAIPRATLRYAPRALEGTFALQSAAGRVAGSAALGLADSARRIRADLTCTTLDLHALPGWPATAFTGRVRVEGRDPSPRAFQGTLALDADPGTIAGRRLAGATLRAALDRGRATIDTLMIGFADAGGSVALSGTAEFSPRMSVDLHAGLQALNVAALTLDTKVTRLTGTVAVRGHGASLDSLTLEPLSIRLAPGAVYGRSVPALSAVVTLAHPGPGRTVARVQSTAGEITLEGRFRLDEAIDRFIAVGNDVGLFVGDSLLPPFVAPQPGAPGPGARTSPMPPGVDLTYHVAITDPSLIGALLGTSIEGGAVFGGELRVDSLGAHQTLDGTFPALRVHSGSTRVGLRAVDLHLAVGDVYAPVDTLIGGRATRVVRHVREQLVVQGTADSLVVDSAAFVRPRLGFAYDAGALRLAAAMTVTGAPAHALRLAGSGRLGDGRLALVLDTLGIARGDTLRWHLEGTGASLAFAAGAITARGVALVSDGARVTVAGTFAAPRLDGVRVTLAHLPLPRLRSYATLDLFNGLEGRLDTLAATIDGTLDSPRVALTTFHAGGIAFRNNPFGDLDAALECADRTVHGEVHLGTRSADTLHPELHRLDVRVNAFPFDPAFGAVAARIPDGQDVDVRGEAVAFPIGFLELVFGGTVDRLRGYATGPLNISGTTPAVRYDGAMVLADVRFRTTTTNITYALQGDLTLRNDTIAIRNAEIRNIREDLAESWARVWGDLYFRGLAFHGFDLYAEADQILVLSRASQRPGSSVYGPLVLSTQPRARQEESLVPDAAHAIHFYGTFETPHLEGTLYTQTSDLVFPETGGTAQGPTFSVTYEMDALQHARDTLDVQAASLPPVALVSTASSDLLDRMQYNLTIVTEQDLRMTMDFSPTEKLKNIRLGGSMTYVRGDDGRAHCIGTLHITGGRYVFYDEFTIDPASTLVYTDDFNNPQLNVIARTPPRLHTANPQGGGPQETEFVQVEVDITGTRLQPKMQLKLLVGPTSNQLQERTDENDEVNRTDALLFLAVHQFLRDFSASSGGGLGAGAGSSAKTQVYTTLSQGLSAALNQYLGGGTLDVQVDEAHPERSRVRVSTQAGKFLVSAGAKPLYSVNSLDLSVSFSLGAVLGVVWLEQTHIEAQRSATEVAGTTVGPAQDAVYSVRITLADLVEGMRGFFSGLWRWMTGGSAPPPASRPTSATGRDSVRVAADAARRGADSVRAAPRAAAGR